MSVRTKPITHSRTLTPQPNQPFNILVVGQTGCGKSSVINILAGSPRAPTSSDLDHCTTHWTEYPIPINGRSFHIFDTIGFLEPGLDTVEYTDAIADTYRAIDALRERGGIDLLLYCVRDEEIEKMKGHYRLLHEVFCGDDVPVALVVTNRGVSHNGYKAIFHSHKITCADYVCVNIATSAPGAAASGSGSGADAQSQKAIQELLVRCCDAGPNPRSRSALQHLWRRVQQLVGMDQSQSLRRNEVSVLLTRRCKMQQAVAEQLLTALNLQLPSSRLLRAPYAGGQSVAVAREAVLVENGNGAGTRDGGVSDTRPGSGSRLHSVMDSTSVHSRSDGE